MTFVFLQYPPVIILFLAAALLTLAAGRLTRRAFFPAVSGGIAAVSMLLCGLYYAIPLAELLALLLVLLLLCGSWERKGGEA